MSSDDYKTVWSSDKGDLRKKTSSSEKPISLEPIQQTASLHRETKGRGGKGVTLIKGLVLSQSDLSALAKKIKQACGTGGTIRDSIIEIQGEDREKIAVTLVKLGYNVKLAGG